MISISQEMIGVEGFPEERGESIGQKVMKGGKDQTKSNVNSWAKVGGTRTYLTLVYSLHVP